MKINPSDFADYTLFVTAASLLTAFMLFGFDTSLIRALSVNKGQSKAIKNKIFSLNGWIALISALLSMLVIFSIGFDNYSIDKIFLFGSALFLSIIFPLAQAGLRAENAYLKLFLSLFIGGVVTPVISILMVSVGYSGEALIYSYVLGVLVSTVIATRFENYHFYNLRITSDQELLEALRIGLPVTITAPLFWAITSLDKWVLNIYTNKTDLGIYALSATLVAPYMMLVSSLITSFQPHALSLLSTNDKKNNLELRNDLVVLIYAMLSIWVIYTLSILIFVKYFLPKQYENIIYIVPILSLAYLCNGLFQIEKIKYLFFKKVKYSIYAMAISALSSAILLLLLVPKYGYFAAAGAQLFGFTAMYLIAKWFGRNDLECLNIDNQLKTVFLISIVFITGYYAAISGHILISSALLSPILIFVMYKIGLILSKLKGSE